MPTDTRTGCHTVPGYMPWFLCRPYFLARRGDPSDVIAQMSQRLLKISRDDRLVLDDEDLCLSHEALDPSFIGEFGERDPHACACISMQLEAPSQLLDQHWHQLPP